MKFLLCENAEGGMHEGVCDDVDDLILTLENDHYHIPGESQPIREWAEEAPIGDVRWYSKGLIVAVRDDTQRHGTICYAAEDTDEQDRYANPCDWHPSFNDTLIAGDEVTSIRTEDDGKVWPEPGDRFQVLETVEKRGIWKVRIRRDDGQVFFIHHEANDMPWPRYFTWHKFGEI